MGIYWQRFPIEQYLTNMIIIYCRPGRSQVGYWFEVYI